MPGAKGLNPHELAHRWVKDLRTRPDMSIKVGVKSPRHHNDFRMENRVMEDIRDSLRGDYIWSEAYGQQRPA